MKRNKPLSRKEPLRPRQAGKKPKGKPRTAKPKAPSVAILDRLFSEYIRLRAGNECQLWGFTGKKCSSQIQCSHIYSRVYHSVRWDPDNAVAACAACHREQHRRPMENKEWMDTVVGSETLAELRERWQNGRKPNDQEKRDIRAWLEKEIKELRG